MSLWYRRMPDRKKNLISRSRGHYRGPLWNTQQSSLRQQLLYGLIHLPVAGLPHRTAGDKNHILTGHDQGLPGTYGLAQQSLGSVANHRLANPLAYRKPETAILQAVGQRTEHQEEM